MPEQPADAELVARARRGDREAFDELVLRYQDRVYAMAQRMLGNRDDALDTAQEIFLSVYRGLDRFEGASRFSTWLYRVTVNRCRDELRRRATVKHTRPASLHAAADRDDAAQPEPASTNPGPEERAIGREAAALLEQAIGELPEDAREVLLLRDVEDLAYDDIAAVLEVPVGTVRSRLNRARTLLRDRIRPILEGGA